jgi:hypothetical protein
LIFMAMGYDNKTLTEERYRRALDAGACAAAKYRPTDQGSYLEIGSNGFGMGQENKNNIPVDRDTALTWFYRVFFRNINIPDGSTELQANYKKFMPMKAILSFDRLMIADADDTWVYDLPYKIRYSGIYYNFTLSDQIQDANTNQWYNITDIGLTMDTKNMILKEYIEGELSGFLSKRKNKDSHNTYSIKIAVNNADMKLNAINGVNVVVFAESLPMPSLNPFNKKSYYGFGIGGTEITRK